MRNTIKSVLAIKDFDKDVLIRGWVRTFRNGKKMSFISINDGSCIQSIQIVVETTKFSQKLLKSITTGVSLQVAGVYVKSPANAQAGEVIANEIKVIGYANPNEYPLQKKNHSLEFLRENAHLRLRTNLFGAIFRIRHHMVYAIHQYFNEKGFFYFNTPILTTSDTEGAGDMFEVITPGTTTVSEFFFGEHTNLTVSGQLEGELGATALGAIYTFSPTFRAENSNTTRHLSEFWMIEPEVAFNDINDNMDLAEDFLKYLVRYALNVYFEEIEYLSQKIDNRLIERLQSVTDRQFIQISYTQAIDILSNSKEQFAFPVSWGADLQSEHERYLIENHFNTPVIVTDYPKDIKAFYMKQNEDGRTVKGMDVLLPKVGEIIGGSEREDRYDVLLKRVRELNMNVENLWWYLDSRKFGSVPHSGFGLGFERLMLFITGMSNIRDVIPFPRTPNSAKF